MLPLVYHLVCVLVAGGSAFAAGVAGFGDCPQTRGPPRIDNTNAILIHTVVATNRCFVF